MSEHTPTPWLHTRSGIEDESYSHISTGPDEYGDIATVWCMDTLGVNNAAFIVKAVNSHDALASALQELLSLVTAIDGCDCESCSPVHHARAALASIKEQS